MEQIQTNSDVTPATPYAYPPLHYDTMATDYVHSLTSTPYYYFAPHYAHASGTYCPHNHYAYNFQMGFPRVNPQQRVPNSVAPYNSFVSPNLYTHDEHSMLQEIGYPQGPLEKSGEESEKFRQDFEKSIDPRIINILEPFRHLYSESEDTLKTMFPGLYSKLSDFFKKVNSLILDNVNADGELSTGGRTLTRSLSLGASPHCKNDRFKVRPIDSEDFGDFPPEDVGGDHLAI